MKKIKVLGTNAVIIGSKLNKLHELGMPERERQFRVICGCTGLADANRQCEAAILKKEDRNMDSKQYVKMIAKNTEHKNSVTKGSANTGHTKLLPRIDGKPNKDIVIQEDEYILFNKKPGLGK